MRHQDIYREFDRVRATFDHLPDDATTLDKALWQVRYYILGCEGTMPQPDFATAEKFLLIETMLLALRRER